MSDSTSNIEALKSGLVKPTEMDLKLSVLIVEKDPEILQAFKLALQDASHELDIIQDNDEVIDCFSRKNYHLAFVGFEQPKLDEICWLKTLKEFHTNIDTEIIFMTSSSISVDREIIKQCLEYGASDFIFKPFDIDVLRLKIKNYHARCRQREALRKQHERLGDLNAKIREQSKSLEDSISYAKLILKKILIDPNKLQIKYANLKLIYRPKDVIGGDFYYTNEINSRRVTICADCTGHGVPGALLTMLGVSFLNEILEDKRIVKAGQILTELDRRMKNYFAQDQHEFAQGMDLSVVVAHMDSETVEYAAAKSLIYVQDDDGIIEEYRGQRVSVGDPFYEQTSFTTHKINVKRPYWIYQFTDGIIDQFGGPKNKKLGRERLKGILYQQKGTAEDRKTEIKNALNSWQKDQSQTDDQTLIINRIQEIGG